MDEVKFKRILYHLRHFSSPILGSCITKISLKSTITKKLSKLIPSYNSVEDGYVYL